MASSAATAASAAGDERPVSFTEAVNNRACVCGRKRCMELLQKYYEDPTSVYPNNKQKKQLFFHLSNPRAKKTNNPGNAAKASVVKQQAFDRAIVLLKPSNVEKPEHLVEIRIAIVHFHPGVIRHFNSDERRGTRPFAEYVLPSDLVASNKLGTAFTDVDRFCCIGSNVPDKRCTKAEKAKMKAGEKCPLDYVPTTRCNCNRYLNAPFVTTENAGFAITSGGSARDRRAAAYSGSRQEEMSTIEADVQSQRAERLEREAAEKQETLEDLRAQTVDMSQKLERAKRDKESRASIRAETREKEKEIKEWKRKFYEEKARTIAVREEADKYKEKYEQTNKKLKAANERERYHSAKSPAEMDFSVDKLSMPEIVRLGLSRRSLMDVQWHQQFDTAARSLFNFETFDEMLTYISILHPRLQDDIRRLKRDGVAKFTMGSYLTPLEQCIICRAGSKVGVTNEQLGFIWGVSKSAIGKIKSKWMPPKSGN